MHTCLLAVVRRRSFSFVWTCSLLLTLLVALAACGNNTTTTGSSNSSNTVAAVTSTPSASTPTQGGDDNGGYGNGYGHGKAKTTPTVASTATTGGSTPGVTITTDSSGRFIFSPTTLTIKVGTTVTWTNASQAPHTVTSDDGTTFDSGSRTPIAPDASFTFTFTRAGTFHYHCAIHPFMTAIIVVQ